VFDLGWFTKRRQNDVEAVSSRRPHHLLFLLHLLPVQTINSENLPDSTHQSKQAKSNFLLILSLVPRQNLGSRVTFQSAKGMRLLCTSTTLKLMNTQKFVLPNMAYLAMLTLYSYLRILIFTSYLAN